jgi:hypothetical protein
MDFIDEQDIAFLNVGEDASEVTGFFDLWARGGVHLGASGLGDEVGEGGFSKTRRTGEEDMVEDVTALFRSFQHEEDAILDFFLADEFRKRRGAQ